MTTRTSDSRAADSLIVYDEGDDHGSDDCDEQAAERADDGGTGAP